MKLNTIAVRRLQNRDTKGFTLIEMIGVLAVIAILAGLLIPKVFGAINDARINNAVVNYEGIKPALIDHYSKYGRFDTLSGTTTLDFSSPYSGYDTNVLLKEGLIDKPFSVKLGTGATVQVRKCVAADATVDGTTAGYSLSGSSTTNEVTGQYVIEAVIKGVLAADAQAISSRIDGQTLSADAGPDLKGRIKYSAVDTNGVTDVYMYLTHR